MLRRARWRRFHLFRAVRIQWRVMILIGVFLAIGVQRVIGEIASPPPQPTLPILKATFQNNLLSLEAHHVPWVKVLSEVRAKTGIFLHVSLSLDDAVSVSFKDLPI